MSRDLTDQDDLEDQYARFLSENVGPRRTRSELTSVPDDAPSRDTIPLADIHRPTTPDLRETHGALLAPQVVRRFGPDAASPAPHVSTTPAEAFPYHAAGNGETVIPGPP